jgi:LAO/AO transport system kinase
LSTSRLTLLQYEEGILSGNRVVLAKAITLIESVLPQDQEIARKLIEKIHSKTSSSIRIGITGVPGVGKSTFIESFGKLITSQGKKIAILTIDPSSQLTKGSILGDKTRMEDLAKNPLAFIRPSASGNTLGGVTGKTREAMLLCEAAGYEIILIETVGVGQSEVAVKNMVDFFLLLMLAGAGDELQGIKKGIMEMADAVVITKADGDNLKHATEAQAEYQYALHLASHKISGWNPPVLTCSSLTGNGIEDVWKMILKYKLQTHDSGFFDFTRAQQNISWFRDYFHQLLLSDYLKSESLQSQSKILENEISEQKISAQHAAHKLLEAYYKIVRESKS